MSILGLKKLNAKLKKLPQAAEEAIKRAMAQGADEMVAMMKSLAPRDSGDLVASIGWTWGDAPKGSMSIGKLQSSDGSLALTIYAGDDKAFYARMVEFGTAPHINGGLFKGTKNPGRKKTPFFYVSFRALRRRTKSRISRAITKSAKQVAAQG